MEVFRVGLLEFGSGSSGVAAAGTDGCVCGGEEGEEEGGGCEDGRELHCEGEGEVDREDPLSPIRKGAVM